MTVASRLEAMMARNVGRREIALHVVARVEADGGVVGFAGAVHFERVSGGLVERQTVEDAGDAERDAGAHQDVAYAGQHGAVNGSQVR
jgi:hypothetical protein